jgi:regulator of nucleoside diphosphate kinase
MNISILDWHRLQWWITQVRENWVDGAEVVRPLTGRLAAARPCDPIAVSDDIVTMNSLVSMREVGTGRPETCRLVYPDAVDEAAGCVSVLSPLGAQLLGARLGESVEQPTPSGTKRFQVNSILFQPEREREHSL